MIKNNIQTEFEDDSVPMTDEQLYFSQVLDIFQKIDELNVTAAGTNPKWLVD